MTTAAAEPVAHHTLRTALPSRASTSRAWLEAAVVAAIALFVRLPGLRREPWGDELYHILSARQYLETGSLGINGGVYARDAVYTQMVAALYRVFGESAVVARLPALAAGVLTIVVLFLWIRRTGHRVAAWIAALLLVCTPALIEQAQYARAYPIQQLFVLLAAVAVSRLLADPAPPPRQAVAAGTAAFGALLVAFYFQPLTLIPAAGLVAGVVLITAPATVTRVPPERRFVAALLVLLLAGAVLFVLVRSGTVERLTTLASYSDLWAARNRGEIRFYHWIMLEDFPTAWTLFPLAIVLAIPRAPRVAALSAAVFVVAFLAHSVMAWKAERYFSHALPFFAAIVGLGAAAAVPFVATALRRLVPDDVASARALRVMAAAGLIGFLLLTNHAFVQTARLVTRDQRFLYPGGETPTLSWSLAAPALRPYAEGADVIVSTEDLEALYFLGRVDYVLDRDHLRQGAPKAEFTVDPRIRARMIGEEESLRAVVACHSSGVLIAMRWALGSYKMGPETAEFIRTELEPIEVPSASGLVAYRWHANSPPAMQRCAGASLTSSDR